jgi:hypothetical protein
MWHSICSSKYEALRGIFFLEHSEIPNSESQSESQLLLVGEARAIDLCSSHFVGPEFGKKIVSFTRNH